MDSVVILSLALTALFIGALVVLVRKAVAPGANLPVTAEWIDELSVDRYRPMLRLLDGDDLEFLRTQPGFSPRMAAKLRSQRCQIFRGYLRCLNADFSRVCAAIKIVMLQSRRDRPDLATALIRHQMLFAAGMLIVHCRLVLF